MPDLYFHLLPGATGSDWLAWAATGAGWVKLCDAGLVAPAQALGARVFYRPYLTGDDGGCADGGPWAQQVIASVMGAAGSWPEAIGFRNEIDGADVAFQVRQYQVYRQALHTAGYRGVVCFGSYGVGWPDWPQWTQIWQAFGADKPDALELHEYWDLTVAGSSPWWALRHQEAIRRALLPPDMPLFIGECGSDQLLRQVSPGHWVGVEDAEQRTGWQDRGKLTAPEMSADLLAYRAGCAPSVVAAFVFADGPAAAPGQRWAAYATRGTAVEETIRGTWKEQAVAGQTDESGAVWAPSPHYWPGRDGEATTAIVLHGTAGPNAWEWFADPASQVSAHYVVDTDGTVYQCVREAESAWHAGVVTPDSVYAGKPNPNYWTIGIEHTRNEANDSPLTAAQIAASIALCRGILGRHPAITAFIPHDAIDVGRVCPGPGFPLAQWQALLTPVASTAAPSVPPLSAEEQAAWNYYTQRGVQVDRTHAIWTACLLPLWRAWAQLAAARDAIADLVKPGPLVRGEYGAMWGGSRPAAEVVLTNRVVGVYEAEDGSWRPYQAEVKLAAA